MLQNNCGTIDCNEVATHLIDKLPILRSINFAPACSAVRSVVLTGMVFNLIVCTRQLMMACRKALIQIFIVCFAAFAGAAVIHLSHTSEFDQHLQKCDRCARMSKQEKTHYPCICTIQNPDSIIAIFLFIFIQFLLVV